MAEELLQNVNVTDDYVLLKFQRSVKVSTIDNDKFIVKIVSPESTVSDPFIDIVIADHYNSISRTLELYWNTGALAVSTDYSLTISGLEDVTDSVIADSIVTFTTDSILVDDPALPPEAEEVTIEDHSIRSTAFTSTFDEYGVDNVTFRVLSVSPEDGSYYLEEDYSNGRITIKFSNRVDNEYVTTPYFKAQRKLIQRAPARWEALTALIYQDGSRPWVYIDLPSVDHFPEAATPSTVTVYGEEGYEYYEPGYKYRVVISGDVST